MLSSIATPSLARKRSQNDPTNRGNDAVGEGHEQNEASSSLWDCSGHGDTTEKKNNENVSSSSSTTDLSLIPPPKRPRIIRDDNPTKASSPSSNKDIAAGIVGGGATSLAEHASSFSNPPLESFPTKILQEIMLYLDCPREVFNLVTNIKCFHQAIHSRPDIVVRAAVFHGGIPKVIVKDINDAIEKKRIYVCVFEQCKEQNVVPLDLSAFLTNFPFFVTASDIFYRTDPPQCAC
jgi:hypothetical protein